MVPVQITQTGVGVTPWKNANIHLDPFSLQIDGGVTGTVTWSIEYTQEDMATPGTVAIVRPTTVAAATISATFTFPYPVRYWRANVTAGTGTLTLDAVQAGITNRN
jgi:hypothetical protein